MGLYASLLRPALFALSPETAHETAMFALRGANPWASRYRRFFRVEDPALRQTVRGLTFPNPVGLAAGFDKDARALPAFEGFGFGFMEAGTLTPRPQPGNPKPRLFRLPEDGALINRMGFNNRGMEDVAGRLEGGTGTTVPLGFNIGKNKDTPLEKAADDYLLAFDRLRRWADFFVINVSSPNTPGLRSLQEPRVLEALLSALSRRNKELATTDGRKPLLLVKVSPDEDAYDRIASAVEVSGFDGVVAVNTTVGRVGLSRPSVETGGMSGRPLRKRALDVLKELRREFGPKFVLIGVGGISDARDAYERILAGASLVEIYTSFIYGGPALVKRINAGLGTFLRGDGFKRIADAVGAKA